MADDQKQRRKDAGKRIQRARRAAGHRSAASFADAIGYSESAIALAETGSPRTGAGLFQKIEETLHMPPMVISTYIETGDESLLEQIKYRSAADEPPKQRPTIVKPVPDDEGFTDEDAQLMRELREMLRTRGVDRVTAAMISAVREHDEESRRLPGEPDIDRHGS